MAILNPDSHCGNVTDMLPCTDFCNSLSKIQLTDNTLLSHGRLLQQLPATREINEWHLGTWSEIQQHDRCDFCHLVVNTILRTVRHVRDEVIDPHQRIDVVLFPDEQSFRLLYPSPLSARLAFVASEYYQPCGPDTARRITSQSGLISKIRRWLHVCNTKHMCSREECTAASTDEEVALISQCFAYPD